MQQQRFLTTPEAADYLRLKPRTLEKWRVQGTGPVHTKIGKRALYGREDLEAWCNQRKRQSTSEA